MIETYVAINNNLIRILENPIKLENNYDNFIIKLKHPKNNNKKIITFNIKQLTVEYHYKYSFFNFGVFQDIEFNNENINLMLTRINDFYTHSIKYQNNKYTFSSECFLDVDKLSKIIIKNKNARVFE